MKRAVSESCLLLCVLGDYPTPTLAVDWKLVLWKENKYFWTRDMDLDPLREMGTER